MRGTGIGLDVKEVGIMNTPGTAAQGLRLGSSVALALLFAATVSFSATLPLTGKYVFEQDGSVIGYETITTVPEGGGYRIVAQTELTLPLLLMSQSSVLEVAPDGWPRRLSMSGVTGGKPFGFVATASWPKVQVHDTVSNTDDEIDLGGPFQWLLPNAVHQIVYLFSRYDRIRQGRQEIPAQLGAAVVEHVGPSVLGGPRSPVAVDHYRMTVPGATIHLFVDAAGKVLLMNQEEGDLEIRLDG